MEWTKPECVEIKMDAEIGSYQLDDGDPPFAAAAASAAQSGDPTEAAYE